MLTLSQIKKIIFSVERLGWTARSNSNFSHFILRSPEGKHMCIHPGDSRRLIKKVLCDFKKLGVSKEQLGI